MKENHRISCLGKYRNKIRKLLLTFATLGLLGFGANAQLDVTLGSGTNTVNYFPSYYNYDFSYTQTIYTVSEFNTAGATGSQTISKIRYKPSSSTSTEDWEDWVIYLGNTAETGFDSNTDWIAVGSLTEVFNGQIDANVTADQWMEITLTTPFVWDGTSNLVVAIDENTDAYGGDPNWYGYTEAPTSGSKGIYEYRDNNPIDPATPPTGSTTNEVAQIQFEMTPTTACSGQPSAGTVDGPSSFSACPNTSFNISMTGVTVGTGMTYQWQGRSAGSSDAWQNAGTSSNLNYPEGAFTADLEFRLIVTCTNSSLSDTSDVVTVTVNPVTDCYCTPTTNYSEYLSSVTTLGALADVNYSATSQVNNGYDDQTALPFEAFASQTFSMTTVYATGSNGVNVWVDWNVDGIFDAAEKMISIANSDDAKTFDITVPGTVTTGTYRMRVRGQSGSSSDPDPCEEESYGSAVDFNLLISPAPSCLPPSNLFASNVSATSADLGWTENGSATQWQVEYGVIGFTQGSGTLELASSNPHTITITDSSEYDFYVRAICGPGDTSMWIGPVSFDNIYCSPSNTYSTSYYINSVQTIGALQNLYNDGTGFGTNGYTDYTTTDTLIVYPGQTVDIQATHPSSTYGYSIWIDWNKNFDFEDAGENVISTGYTSSPFNGTFTVPADAVEGVTRLRIRNAYLSNPAPVCGSHNYGEAEDYAVKVLPMPTCLPPTDLTVSNIQTNQVDLGWTDANGASSFTIEYGPMGFEQGTGTQITGVSSNPYTLTNLNPSTGYTVYVSTDCGGGDISYWAGPFSFYTACGVVVAPFSESFDYAEQPQCWTNYATGNNYWEFNEQGGYAAEDNGRDAGTFAMVDGSTPNPDSVLLITPEIDLSALVSPYLGFEWFSNNTNNPGDNNPLIVSASTDSLNWIVLDTLAGDSAIWQFASYDLSQFAGQTIRIAFNVNLAMAGTAYYNDILLDEINIDNCGGVGQDGATDVCTLDGSINLNSGIIVSPGEGGVWQFENPALITNDSIFDYSTLMSGTYNVEYVIRTVCYDTVVASITVHPASSAGEGSTITVCKNEPINLYDGLTGNADLGGEWYDFNGDLLENSQPNASAIPGNYNYKYIANNGYCPADTATIEVIVSPDCDYWSVGSEEFANLSVYPNPATTVLNIDNPSNASDLQIEILDMNGRVVMFEDKALNNASHTSLNVEQLEKGIYTLRIYNDENQRVFKIVKQ